MNPQRAALHDGVELRALRGEDARAVYEAVLRNRARLQRWFSWVGDHVTFGDIKQYVDGMTLAPEPRVDMPFGFWHGERYLGGVGLYKIDYKNRIARIAYWIDERYERRGLVTSAVKVLIAHAFVNLGLNRIEIRCAPGNTSSRAIPARLGFREEGVHRQVLRMPDGRFEDLIMHALLRSDGSARATHHPS